MPIQPTPNEFFSVAKPGLRIPIFLELTADSESPISAYAKLAEKKPAFLFESVVGGENISRFSFLGSSPKKIFVFIGTKRILNLKMGQKKN